MVISRGDLAHISLLVRVDTLNRHLNSIPKIRIRRNLNLACSLSKEPIFERFAFAALARGSSSPSLLDPRAPNCRVDRTPEPPHHERRVLSEVPP